MPPEVKIDLHPVNLIIISGILQSMILSGILIFSRKGKRSANVIGGLFVLICSLHFSWSLMIDTNVPDIFRQIFWFPYSYLLAIGPLLFFYTKSLTTPHYRINIKETVHFLPVAAEVLIQLIFIVESIRNNIVHYDVHGFLWFRVLEFTGTAASILMYGRKSLELIRIHESSIAQNFSNQKNITLIWLFTLIKFLRVLWMFWLTFELSFILFLQFQMHFIPVYLVLYILLGGVTYSTYWIGIQALGKSEMLIEKIPVTVPAGNTSVYSRLSESEFGGYVESISQLMRQEKLYLHESLSLRMLANRLQMDPNLVSYVLNTILHKSFHDYVNELRIEEVKSKIESPAYSHFKIVEIAYECGFNSKATFNRVFKKLTGISPSEYKKPVA
jgi:AraC-like DNA-binding protein